VELFFTDAFVIDNNGHLRTTTTLDREQTDYYEFTVMSYDAGVPTLSGSTLVKVNVTDINDNTPVIMGFDNMAALCEVGTTYICIVYVCNLCTSTILLELCYSISMDQIQT